MTAHQSSHFYYIFIVASSPRTALFSLFCINSHYIFSLPLRYLCATNYFASHKYITIQLNGTPIGEV